ncbi:DUF2303 family protein [Paracoccus sp. (in: a-proteobacteria)]|uniref:DUF2303 family protein n=1 Tax=Paracoccus sp. TaxID=267 RepID=UPI002AFFC0B7|nr:DUF2303 family protein [Paracoccus sp. (in: a-proteobacteria)]
MSETTPVAPGFDAKFIAQLGEKAAEAQLINIDATNLNDPGFPESIPVLWNPKDGMVISLKDELEGYRQRPARRKGTAVVQTLGSFIALVNHQKIEAESVVFADTDWTAPSFTAVLDYHPAVRGTYEPDAGNGQHRVHYPFPLSEEWTAWVKQNGEVMNQLDFATFLEDRAPELAAPTEAEVIALEQEFSTTVATPAKLVQLSRGLKVHVSSQLAEERTLNSGEGQIKWEEVHKNESGEPLKVPGIFLLSVAPFKSGEKVRIPVRLRYRPQNGRVLWFYEIYRPDLHITERVEADLDKVASETGLPTFEGKPEMPGA